MKKLNNVLPVLVILTCALFQGCFNPVFNEIRKDVKPEDTTVKSPVNMITRFTVSDNEFLVIASDEGIRYKRADSGTHSEWKTYGGLPFSLHYYDFDDDTHKGEQIIGVYSSSDTFYILSTAYGVDDTYGTVYPAKFTLWGAPASELTATDATWEGTANWVKIIEDSDNTYFPMYIYNSYYYSAFSMFQTNSVKKENREVYIRKGNTASKAEDFQTITYYALSGTAAPTEVTLSPVDSTTENCIRSAVSMNGTTYFFNSYAATTNETKDSAATYYYYANGGTVCYGTNGTDNASAVSLDGKDISALAACSDVLLIGCADYGAYNSSGVKGGIHKTTLENGIPGNSTASFSTNAQFQITSAYYVTALLNATPERTEAESYLYCASQLFGSESGSTASFSDVGLWSFYPDRGNWNRE